MDLTKKNEEMKKKVEELEDSLKKSVKVQPEKNNQEFESLKIKYEKIELENRNMSLEIVKLQTSFENLKKSSKNESDKLHQINLESEKEKKTLNEKLKIEISENKKKDDRIKYLEGLIKEIHKISSLDGIIVKPKEIIIQEKEPDFIQKKIIEPDIVIPPNNDHMDEIIAPVEQEVPNPENPLKRKLSSDDLSEPELKKKEIKFTTNDHLKEYVSLDEEEFYQNLSNFCLALWKNVNKKEVTKFVKGIARFIGEFIESLNPKPSKMTNLVYMLYVTSPKEIDLMKLLYNYLTNSIFKKKTIDNFVYYLSSGLSLISNIKYKKGEFNLESALRVLCYELLREKLSSSIRIIFSILGANPKILKSPSQSVLSLTIQSIISDLKRSQVSLHQNEIEACQNIEKIYNWKSDIKTIDEVIDILIEAIRDSESPDPNIISEKDFEIVKSLELISALKSWQWTYSELIIKRLWQLLKPPSNDSDQRRSILLFTLIGTLGKLGLTKSDNGIDELRKRLAIVLSDKGQKLFSLEAQIAAANGLVELSLEKQNLQIVFTWFEKYSQFKYLPHKLKSIYNTYQESKQFIIPNAPKK